MTGLELLLVTSGGSLVMLAVLDRTLPARRLTASKPSVVLLPKYRFEVRVAGDAGPRWRAHLKECLQTQGLRESKQTSGTLEFVGGSAEGVLLKDRAAKAKVKLTARLRAESKVEFQLQYAPGIGALDTGELWSRAHALRQSLVDAL